MTYVIDLVFRGYIIFLCLFLTIGLSIAGIIFSQFSSISYDRTKLNYDVRFLDAYFSMAAIGFVLFYFCKPGSYLYHFFYIVVVCFTISLILMTISGIGYLQIARYLYETEPQPAKLIYKHESFTDLQKEFPLATFQGFTIFSSLLVLAATFSYRKHEVSLITL